MTEKWSVLQAQSAVEAVRDLFLDPHYLAQLSDNTAAHIGSLIDELLGETGVPPMHVVATLIGSLLEARREICWGIGDLLVAVSTRIDQEAETRGHPPPPFAEYLRALSGLLPPDVGYWRLWMYHSASSLIPRDKRVPEFSFTWHYELTRLAAAMTPLGIGATTRAKQKQERVFELLEEAGEEGWGSIEMKRRRAEAVRMRRGIEFRIPLPRELLAVDTETGEVATVLTFEDTQQAVPAGFYLLQRMGLYALGMPYVRILLQGQDLVTASGQVIAHAGDSPLAVRGLEVVRERLGIRSVDAGEEAEE